MQLRSGLLVGPAGGAGSRPAPLGAGLRGAGRGGAGLDERGGRGGWGAPRAGAPGPRAAGGGGARGGGGGASGAWRSFLAEAHEGVETLYAGAQREVLSLQQAAVTLGQRVADCEAALASARQADGSGGILGFG